MRFRTRNGKFQDAGRRSRLVDELVINDRCRKADFAIFLLRRIFGTHHAALADDVAVLLPRNLFGHFEDHLYQSVYRKGLRPNEENAALADVLNDALVPTARLVHAITQRDIELQTAGSWYPGRPFLARMAAPNAGLGFMLHALGTAHGRPIIFVFRSAEQANLVVVAIRTTARPGELVRAAPKHKHIHEFLRHDGITSGSVEPSDARTSSR